MRGNLRKALNRMRDPSRAGKLRVAYGDHLDKLFLNFKADVKKRLGARELAEPSSIATMVADKQIRYSIEVNIRIPARRVIQTDITKAYTTGAQRSVTFLEALGVKTAYTQMPVDQKVISILEQRNLSDLDGITAAMSQDIMRTVTDGVMDGKGIEAIAREIDEDIDGIGRTRARLLARTETMTAFNRAATTQYQKIGVEEVEWYTSHLENVCEDCESLDRQRFPINEAPPCPYHPNCPCILLPVIEIEAFK
ncbi:MAG: phage minor head protein [Candidatus Eisenbacteria bacterium]